MSSVGKYRIVRIAGLRIRPRAAAIRCSVEAAGEIAAPNDVRAGCERLHTADRDLRCGDAGLYRLEEVCCVVRTYNT